MGNRATVVEFGKLEGIDQHWNGGFDSIAPMLYYAKNFLTNVPDHLYDTPIKKLYFVSLCCGFEPIYNTNYSKLDCNNGDNGTYVIDKDFNIITRMFFKGAEQKHYDFSEVLLYIDENMPKHMQKGKDFILKHLSSYEFEKDTVRCSDDKYYDEILFDKVLDKVKVDDIVFYRGNFYTIVGVNDKESIVNGTNVKGIPFFNFTENYGEDYSFKVDHKTKEGYEKLKDNPNSYLHRSYVHFTLYGENVAVLDDNNFRIVDKEKLKEYLDKYQDKEAVATN